MSGGDAHSGITDPDLTPASLRISPHHNAQPTTIGHCLPGVDHEIEKAIQADNTILETERIALVRARVGQGQYRQNLMAIETQCRITGVKDPRLLRASHIKPWRSCATNAERLDGNNGLLLSPTVDHLFDRGYLSFTDAGGVMLSPLIDAADFGRLGLSSAAAATFGSFSLEQSVFLEYHRRVVFKRVAPAALP